MRNVGCWREPRRAQTITGHHHRLLNSTRAGCRHSKVLDDVWLSVQRMVAVHPGPGGHLPASAGLLAARLQLQCLSMPGAGRRLSAADCNVDEEVSRLLCRPPSPQLALGRPRRRNRGPVKRDLAADVSTRWAEMGRDKSSLCRLRGRQQQQQQHEAFKRPCLDFDKMQASHTYICAVIGHIIPYTGNVECRWGAHLPSMGCEPVDG